MHALRPQERNKKCQVLRLDLDAQTREAVFYAGWLEPSGTASASRALSCRSTPSMRARSCMRAAPLPPSERSGKYQKLAAKGEESDSAEGIKYKMHNAEDKRSRECAALARWAVGFRL